MGRGAKGEGVAGKKMLKTNAKLPKKFLTIVPSFYETLRVIPQGTVDNNLGPDRLVGPKALDPNYCRQPTL